MFRTRFGLPALALLAAATAQGRPLDRPPVPIFTGSVDSPPGDRSAPGGTFSTAAQETVYFGGTFWNSDSSRWEAIRDSTWTFDSGVGSSFNHALRGEPLQGPLAARHHGGMDRDRQDVQ